MSDAPKEPGLWVQLKDGKWVLVGDVDSAALPSVKPPYFCPPTLSEPVPGAPLHPDLYHGPIPIHGTLEQSWFTPPLQPHDPEAELQRSTYERPSDDELRARIRGEFGV